MEHNLCQQCNQPANYLLKIPGKAMLLKKLPGRDYLLCRKCLSNMIHPLKAEAY